MRGPRADIRENPVREVVLRGLLEQALERERKLKAIEAALNIEF